MELFFKAVLKKFRYNTGRTKVNTEDLFDLPLDGEHSLNSTAVILYEQLQAVEKKSFVKKAATTTTLMEQKLDVVKAIIKYKQDLAEAATKRAEKQAQRQKLLAIKERKLDEQLGDMSLDDIDAQLEALEKES